MIDVRQVCKVFLEFVYENRMLPESIIDILKNRRTQQGDSLEWDFGEIMTIFSWNKHYAPSGNPIKAEIMEQTGSFGNDGFDEDKIQWLEKHGKDKDNSFKKAIDYRNNFFHNVSIESGTRSFCSLLEEFIMDAPVSETVRREYIRKIEDYRNNTPEYLEDKLKEKNKELEKLKETAAQLRISLLQANEKTLPIKEKYSSFPKSEEIRDFWNDHIEDLKLIRDNSKYANYGKASMTHPEAYWASPNLEKLKTDWYYILRREEKNTLKLLFVPANAISKDQVKIDEKTKQRTEDQKKQEFDVFIRDDNYEEELTGLSFEKYVCAIADFNTMEIRFPKHNK